MGNNKFKKKTTACNSTVSREHRARNLAQSRKIRANSNFGMQSKNSRENRWINFFAYTRFELTIFSEFKMDKL